MKYLKLITSDAKIEQSNKYRTIYYNTTTDSLSVGGDFVIMTSESNPEAMEACHAQGWAVESDKMWKSEAEAVQSIEIGTFSSVTHFHEFKYFKNAETKFILRRAQILGGIFASGPISAISTVLTSVTLPNVDVLSGTCCFCSGLTSVTIPNSVTSIGDSAFYNCSGLTSVTIPNSVTSIGGGGAFQYCRGLKSVTIPNSVTSIGDSAFRYCSSLTSVTIPDSVTSIGNNVFYGCASLTAITIPNSVTSIGIEAFSYCTNLTSVSIPNSVTSIGRGAFYNCSSLTSITIPDSVTSIGGGAFQYCRGLTSVTIPNSVTSIGNSAFSNCSSLTSVTYNGTTAQWSAITKGNNWKNAVPSTCIVHCTDGDIPIADA